MNEEKKKKGISGFVDEFRKFISKGNVIDLAVGVIIGGAFTSIVSSLVDDMIMPIVGTVLAGINFKSFGIEIPWGNHPFINIGNFIQAVIVFLLTALCVFGIVKLISVFYKREKPKPKPTKEEELLTEIRDLLKLQNGISPETKEEKDSE
ncbi:MAG: large conductance mechanosensitive channel protein MscL [Porcipelethomonas sp.]